MIYIEKPIYTPLEALKNYMRLLIDEALSNLEHSNERYSSLLTNNDTNAMVRAAKMCVKNKNFSKAESLLKACNPKDKYAIFELGKLYSRQKQYKEAEKMFKGCMKLYPTYDPAVFELGNLYISMGKYKHAEKMFEKCARLNQRHIPSRFALARMVMPRDIKKAEAYKNEIQKINPKAQCIEKISKRIDQVECYKLNHEDALKRALEHIKKHEENDPKKSLHGVFSSSSAGILTVAWQNRGKVRPKRYYELDIYDIPFQNAGYLGGIIGQGEKLNFVTIITIANTNYIITAFPSMGNAKPFCKKKVQLSATDYGDVLFL